MPLSAPARSTQGQTQCPPWHLLVSLHSGVCNPLWGGIRGTLVFPVMFFSLLYLSEMFSTFMLEDRETDMDNRYGFSISWYKPFSPRLKEENIFYLYLRCWSCPINDIRLSNTCWDPMKKLRKWKQRHVGRPGWPQRTSNNAPPSQVDFSQAQGGATPKGNPKGSIKQLYLERTLCWSPLCQWFSNFTFLKNRLESLFRNQIGSFLLLSDLDSAVWMEPVICILWDLALYCIGEQNGYHKVPNSAAEHLVFSFFIGQGCLF